VTGDSSLFQTDTVRAELRHRAMRSGAIAAGSRIASIALQLGSMVVLARMLTPRDFGIQAMVLPLTILFNSIVNMGLQTVVIQREDLGPREANAMFWLGLRVNLVLAALMGLAGFLLSLLNRTPEMVPVAVAWAAVIYLASTAAVHEALLKRQLRFGVVWGAHLGATVVSVAAAIVAAAGGAGHWALMVQIAVMELGRASVVWVVSAWRPSGPRSATAEVATMRDHWLRIGGFRILSMSGDQLDRVVAGTVGGAATLGLYETAKRWAWLPHLDLFLSLSDVAVSSLSRVQSDPARYRRYFEFALLGILSVSIPAIGFIFLNAGPILVFLLGDRWLGAEPFLRVMALAALTAALTRPMQWIYLSRGESARQLRWTLVTTPIMIAGVLLGARYGGYGVAVGFALAAAVLLMPSIGYAIHGTPVTIGDLRRAMGRPIAAAIGAGALLVATRETSTAAPGTTSSQLGGALIIYGAGYLAVWLGLPGGRLAARELFDSVRGMRGKPPSTTTEAE
jgi:PST family polysaccharide transporter